MTNGGNDRFVPPFTIQQQHFLAICPKITSVPSMIGSIYILQHVLRSTKRRHRVYTRILVGMSLMDLMYAIKCFLSTWPIPSTTATETYGAVGTTASCTAAGFLGQGSSLSSILYNGTLTFYYLVTIRYGWTQSKFLIKNSGKDKNHAQQQQQQQRQWSCSFSNHYCCCQWECMIHGIPLAVGWSTAIVSLPLQLMNPVGWTCWIAPFPLGCDDDDDETESICIRGTNSKIYRWLFFHAILWCVFVFVIVSMILVYVKIKRDEQMTILYSIRHSFSSYHGKKPTNTTIGENQGQKHRQEQRQQQQQQQQEQQESIDAKRISKKKKIALPPIIRPRKNENQKHPQEASILSDTRGLTGGLTTTSSSGSRPARHSSTLQLFALRPSTSSNNDWGNGSGTGSDGQLGFDSSNCDDNLLEKNHHGDNDKEREEGEGSSESLNRTTNGSMTHSLACQIDAFTRRRRSYHKNGSNGKHRNRHQRERDLLLSRRFAVQATFYVSAFFIAWIFNMLQFAITQHPGGTLYFPILVLIVIINPMQGFLNALIYIRPRYIRYRDKQRQEKEQEDRKQEKETRNDRHHHQQQITDNKKQHHLQESPQEGVRGDSSQFSGISGSFRFAGRDDDSASCGPRPFDVKCLTDEQNSVGNNNKTCSSGDCQSKLSHTAADESSTFWNALISAVSLQGDDDEDDLDNQEANEGDEDEDVEEAGDI